MSTVISFKKTKAPDAVAPAPAPVTPTVVVPVVVAPAPAPVAVAPVKETIINVTTAAPQVAAPATQTTAGAMVTNDHYQGIGGFEGEFSSKDMATPYLGLFGKTSKGFEENPSWLGQWVYDKSIPLGTKIRVVFLRAKKWIIEDLPFGSKEIPQRFTKMEDARAAGFNEGTLADTADLDLLIEIDASVEGVSDLAHVFDADKAYILCRYGVRSSAYGKTIGILTKDASGFLKGNLINGFYDMETSQRTGPKGTYYVPILKTAGRTSDSLRAGIIQKLTTPTV